MAQVDPAINDPTPTGAMADRVDAYRIAVAEIKRAGYWGSVEADEVLRLAEFLYFGQDS